MSEGKLAAVWDGCIADAVVKTGTGDNIIVFVLSLTLYLFDLFKK